MSEEVLKTEIAREEGYLYYCKSNPLIICKTKMVRGRKKKEENNAQ